MNMALQPITLSADATFCCDGAPAEAHDDAPCAFCGVMSGPWLRHGYLPPGTDPKTSHPACPLCTLPQHLERPHIDEEAVLVWLPEFSQPALNTTMREIHIALQVLGEDVHADAVFRKRTSDLRSLYYARAVVAERSGAAAARVGTTSPRQLGVALLELSPAAYAWRGELLGGLRLMPLGRFFRDDQDVYAEIIAFWRNGSRTLPIRSEGTP